jgi:hypothetical protein
LARRGVIWLRAIARRRYPHLNHVQLVAGLMHVRLNRRCMHVDFVLCQGHESPAKHMVPDAGPPCRVMLLDREKLLAVRVSLRSFRIQTTTAACWWVFVAQFSVGGL